MTVWTVRLRPDARDTLRGYYHSVLFDRRGVYHDLMAHLEDDLAPGNPPPWAPAPGPATFHGLPLAAGPLSIDKMAVFVRLGHAPEVRA